MLSRTVGGATCDWVLWRLWTLSVVLMRKPRLFDRLLKFQQAVLAGGVHADISAGMWDEKQAHRLSRRERQVVDIVMNPDSEVRQRF